jgi:putative ABC transport system substrate-binding protein
LGTATPSAWGQRVAAFVQRLRELGWIEDRTIAIEYRWAEGHPMRFAEIAAELVRLKVDVIVTAGDAVRATQHTTSVIPIVFAVACRQAARDDRPDAGHRPQPLARGILINERRDLAGDALDALIEATPVSGEVLDHPQYARREHIAALGQDGFAATSSKVRAGVASTSTITACSTSIR